VVTECQDKGGLRGLYRRFWYVPDLILVVLLLCYGTFVHTSCLREYIGGLENTGLPMFVFAFQWAMLLPPVLICLVLLAGRVAGSWPRHVADRRRLRRLRVATIVGLGGYLILGLPVFQPRDPSLFMRGFGRYVQTYVDVPAIRAWLNTVDPNVCTGAMVELAIVKDWKSTGWPLAIKSLRPDSLELHRDSANRPTVRLAWCGFDDAWGVAIGSEDMEIPKTQPPPPVKVGDRTFYEGGEYRLPLAPGVYVWRDIR
jgi:hypothetical protein